MTCICNPGDWGEGGNCLSDLVSCAKIFLNLEVWLILQGMVRYWPSIAHEGSSTEISTELGGQVAKVEYDYSVSMLKMFVMSVRDPH